VSAALQKAVHAVGQQVTDAIYKIECMHEDGTETGVHVQALRNARCLLGVLAHITGGMSVQRAYGAPGDWGYDTPLGDGVLDLLRQQALPPRGQQS
jgi:hypothetical protein